jgi:muramoyltetrapeptide carboxypeptidase
MRMVNLPHLSQGDLIALVAPAKAIQADLVLEAKDFFELHGFRVEIGEYAMGHHHYFSGTDLERTVDFQQAIDNPDVKAIVCLRGGYGCVRILDRLNWASMLRFPKWIVGFSDVTVFHQRMQRFGLPSLHATMPLNYGSNSQEALYTMLDALHGKQAGFVLESQAENKPGTGEGQLTGGNLSILYSLLGTDDQPDYSETILFIEDLSEPLYQIDRMFYALAKAGILDRIRGLVVGGMTDLKDSEIPFGLDYKEIILSHFAYRNIPVTFDFPAGHIDDNRALVLGAAVRLTVTETEVKLEYL